MPHRVKRLHALVILPLAALAASWPAGRAQAAPTGTLSASYDGFAHGVLALRLTASFTLTPGAYSARLEFHTAGMLGWMVRTESDSQVVGRFVAGRTDAAMPLHFDATGFAHGHNRLTHIVYEAGNPVVQMLQPPAETERQAVPAPLTAHTVDTLSAIALLMRQVAETQSCSGSARTFDGRRLTSLTATTAGPAMLAPNRQLGFDGKALRCDFVGTELAGFLTSKDEALQRRPRHGTAWVAPLVPGAPPLPVKVVFDHDQLGTVTLVLTSVSGGPGAVAQAK